MVKKFKTIIKIFIFKKIILKNFHNIYLKIDYI